MFIKYVCSVISLIFFFFNYNIENNFEMSKVFSERNQSICTMDTTESIKSYNYIKIEKNENITCERQIQEFLPTKFIFFETKEKILLKNFFNFKIEIKYFLNTILERFKERILRI